MLLLEPAVNRPVVHRDVGLGLGSESACSTTTRGSVEITTLASLSNFVVALDILVVL